MESKTRKTLNISLQAQEYSTPMNELIQQWDEKGANISIEVCKNLLAYNKITSSKTIGTVLDVYDVVKRILNRYGINDERKIEEILSKVIYFDMSGLNEVFLTINQFYDPKVNSDNVDDIFKQKEVIQKMKTQIIEETSNENKTNIEKPQIKVETSTKLEEQKVDDVPIPSSEVDIPMDFLMNG